MSSRGNCIVHVPRRFVADEWGGTETVILEIARQQQRAGYETRVETSMALAKSRSELIGGVPVLRHSYCYPFLGLSRADCMAMDKKGGNLLSLPLFWSLLRTKNVRIFHAHALKRVGGTVRTAAKIRRKPFVVSLHGGVFDVPSEELAESRGDHLWLQTDHGTNGRYEIASCIRVKLGQPSEIDIGVLRQHQVSVALKDDHVVQAHIAVIWK